MAQNATFRGFVFDKETGEPLALAIVTFTTINQGAYTDASGLFNIADLESELILHMPLI